VLRLHFLRTTGLPSRHETSQNCAALVGGREKKRVEPEKRRDFETLELGKLLARGRSGKRKGREGLVRKKNKKKRIQRKLAGKLSRRSRQASVNQKLLTEAYAKQVFPIGGI